MTDNAPALRGYDDDDLPRQRKVTLFGKAGDTSNSPIHGSDEIEGEWTNKELDEMAWEHAVDAISVEHWWEEGE